MHKINMLYLRDNLVNKFFGCIKAFNKYEGGMNFHNPKLIWQIFFVTSKVR